MFNSIKNYFKRKSYEKTRKLESGLENTRKRINHLSDVMESLKLYDDYIEYKGVPYDIDSDKFGKYDFTNARNMAEILMFSRLKAVYGTLPMHLHQFDTMYPLDTIGALMDFEKDESGYEVRRLYFKAHGRDEKCKLCEMNAEKNKEHTHE